MKKLILFAIMVVFASYVQAAEFGDDRHIKRGLTCQTCHGQDLKNPQEPADKDCLKCHPREKLIEKTKNLHPSVNPHNPPHNGECILCHLQHEAPINNCAECHKYEFKMK